MSLIIRRIAFNSDPVLRLCAELKAQKPNYIFDRIRHAESSPFKLLDIALSEFVPKPPGSRTRLATGYHLVLFPPQVSSQYLLPDGTDRLHYPGEPWVKRMWAGGSIDFGKESRLNEVPKYTIQCRERIRNAIVKGPPEDEKLWVDLDRLIAYADAKSAAIVERRNLVFMRAWPAGKPCIAEGDDRLIKRMLLAFPTSRGNLKTATKILP